MSKTTSSIPSCIVNSSFHDVHILNTVKGAWSDSSDFFKLCEILVLEESLLFFSLPLVNLKTENDPFGRH